MRTFLLSAPVLLLVILLCAVHTSAREGSTTRPDVGAAEYQPSSSGRTRQTQPNPAGKPNTRRLREGTVVSDQTGYFREDGDGASFVSDTGMEFGALQNLNLERVVRLLKNADEPSSIRWSVTGKVTEFSGRNYLLISRAVYKSATPPPLPGRVAPER